MVLAVTGLLLTLTVAAPADVTGKWDGKITGQREDGTTNEDSALLILEQKGTTITGTAGGNDSDRHPITSGTIEGNKVSLTVKNAKNGRELSLALTLDGDEMKGTITAGERQGQVVLKRRKD